MLEFFKTILSCAKDKKTSGSKNLMMLLSFSLPHTARPN